MPQFDPSTAKLKKFSFDPGTAKISSELPAETTIQDSSIPTSLQKAENTLSDIQSGNSDLIRSNPKIDDPDFVDKSIAYAARKWKDLLHPTEGLKKNISNFGDNPIANLVGGITNIGHTLFSPISTGFGIVTDAARQIPSVEYGGMVFGGEGLANMIDAPFELLAEAPKIGAKLLDKTGVIPTNEDVAKAFDIDVEIVDGIGKSVGDLNSLISTLVGLKVYHKGSKNIVKKEPTIQELMEVGEKAMKKVKKSEAKEGRFDKPIEKTKSQQIGQEIKLPEDAANTEGILAGEGKSKVEKGKEVEKPKVDTKVPETTEVKKPVVEKGKEADVSKKEITEKPKVEVVYETTLEDPKPVKPLKADSEIQNFPKDSPKPTEAKITDLTEAEVKKLKRDTMFENAEGTLLNSPKLGKYRNQDLNTSKVLAKLKDYGLLDEVKKLQDSLPIQAKDAIVKGSEYETLARIMLKKFEEGNFKPTEIKKPEVVKPKTKDVLTETPIAELPETLGKPFLDAAAEMRHELDIAEIKQTGAGGAGNVGSTTINTFPDWFDGLKRNKKHTMEALDKILDPNIKEKGQFVSQLKEKILDRLLGNAVESQLLGSSGKFSRDVVGKIEGNADFIEFTGRLTDNMTLDEIKAEYKKFEKEATFDPTEFADAPKEKIEAKKEVPPKEIYPKGKEEKNKTVLDTMKSDKGFTLDELSEISKKPKIIIAEELRSLLAQKLLEKTEKGYKSTEEFNILLDDMIQKPDKYNLATDQLSSNPIPQIIKGFGDAVVNLDNLIEKAVGRPIYNTLAKVLKKITPEKVKDILVTNYGLPELYLDKRMDAKDAIQRYNELAKEIGDNLHFSDVKGKIPFSEAEQKRLGQIIKGSITKDPILKERGARAIAEIKQLETLGKELGVLPIETYNTKLPRKRINELLTEKRKLELESQKIKINLERSKIKTLLETAGQRLDALQKTREKLDGRIKNDKEISKAERVTLQDRIEAIDSQIATATGEKLQLQNKLNNPITTKSTNPRTRQLDKQIDFLDQKVKNSFKHGGEGYFKRVYLSKEQQKNFSKYGYFRPTRLDLTSAIHRKDIPIEIRKQMGEVLEAAYPVSKGIMLEGKDVSLGNFFQAIAEHPDWVSPTERGGFVQMQDSPKLGKLKGQFVEERIAADINDVLRLTSPEYLEGFLKNVNSIWKATKTIMNPSTHSRNVMSNSVMLDFSGVPHTEQMRLAPEAWQAIRGKGKYAAQFKASRLATSTFKTKELGQYLDVLGAGKGFMDMSVAEKIAKIYGKVSGVDTKLGEKLGDLYQAEETFFKAIKFISEIEKGKSIKEARNEANKWLFDYGEIPKAIDFMRNNPLLGMPFVTWSYKALPRVIETAITRPISFWKYPAMFSAATAYSLKNLDVTEKEWEDINKDFPEKLAQGSWMLLPFRDSNGKMQMMDMTYILPYKDAEDLMRSGYTLATQGKFDNGKDVIEGAFNLINAPAMTMIKELSLNKNGYTDRPIWNSIDKPGTRLQKQLDYLYKMYMPSLTLEIPGISKGGYSWHKLASAIRGSEDYYGRNFTVVPAIASAFLGVKTTPIDPQANRERKYYDIQSTLIEWSREKSRVKNDPTIDETDKYERLREIELERAKLKAEQSKLGVK